MANVDKTVVRSLYDLPTYQRRLRHLRNISIKNLQCKSFKGKDVTRLHVYFTLHTDRNLKEFYRSESISGSLNPAWQSFDVSRHEHFIDIQRKDVYLLVWVKDGRSMDAMPYLLVDWHINLSGLVYFSEKLQRDKCMSISNMVMVGMYDKYFIAPEKPIEHEQDVLLVDSSVALRGSYTLNSLNRIHTVLLAISQMKMSVKKVHTSIENRLVSSMEKSKKLSAREDLILKVGLLKAELSWQMNKLQHQQQVHENCCKTTAEKNGDLKLKFQELTKKMSSLEEKRKLYYQTREKFIKENYQLLIRKKQLISELTTYIYPITEKGKELYICGVYLPNSEQFQGQDDTMCSVALGYTCHLVEKMSQILDIPLRYPMNHNSSKSTITDHIHSKLNEKDKTFPLFMKGKEKFQFNYGVFLLNKNISQMRFNCGLGTVDLRLTLPNIKSMLESRLGIKFENPDGLKPRTDLRDNFSLPSTEMADTMSSLASGGKNGHEEMNEMEQVLRKKSLVKDHVDPLNMKENISPVPLTELRVGESEGTSLTKDGQELFRPSEDAFFKLKTTGFNADSAENSSVGSFSDQINDSTLYARNFSLSPSPGSVENELIVNQSESVKKSIDSKTSPMESDDILVNQSGSAAGPENVINVNQTEKTSPGSDNLVNQSRGADSNLVNQSVSADGNLVNQTNGADHILASGQTNCDSSESEKLNVHIVDTSVIPQTEQNNGMLDSANFSDR